VYEGLCQATSDVYASGSDVVRLWRNECCRIFVDRLITPSDADMVKGMLGDLITANFADCAASALAEPSMFGDFQCAVGRLVSDKEDPHLYRDLGDFGSVGKILDAVLEQYNTEHKAMSLVLFEFALDHLTRLLRILRLPRGNVLLVGVGGSGKQSLTRLGAYTAGYALFEITLVRNYGEPEFREDLKTLYKKLNAGPVVFLFTDAHVVEEGFLELINNMLTVGMVPALYESDERDALVNSVRG
jgi:dynein heavy chain